MNLYEEAIKIWLARRFGPGKFWAEDISNIRFGIDWTGGCSSCWDSVTALEFTVTRNGKSKTYKEEIEDLSPAKFVEECLEIYFDLRYRKKDPFKT